MKTDSTNPARVLIDDDTPPVATSDEPRGAESSGDFAGGSWRVYALREKGHRAGFMLHVRVAE